MTTRKQIILSGTTQVYGVVADPIAQVQSPEVFNVLFKERSIDAVCIPFHVKSDDLAAFLQGSEAWQNCRGIFVSVPHKEHVFSLVAEHNPAAEAVGACNVLRRLTNGGWYGGMFDGYGLVDGMIAHKRSPCGKRVIVLGAGGVAAAIVHALLETGAREVVVCNRTQVRAHNLRDRLVRSLGERAGERLKVNTSGEAFAEPADFLVQATSLGMKDDDPMPVDASVLQPPLTVVEVVAKPPLTRLLTCARERGCLTIRGTVMFDHQVERLVNFFPMS